MSERSVNEAIAGLAQIQNEWSDSDFYVLNSKTPQSTYIINIICHSSQTFSIWVYELNITKVDNSQGWAIYVAEMVSISACLSILPMSWQMGLLNWVFKRRKHIFRGPVHDCTQRAALNILDPYCISNVTHMGHLELQQVRILTGSAKKICRIRMFCQDDYT